MASAAALMIVCAGVAPAHAATKRCGSLADPLQRSVKVKVNITDGKAVSCTLARKVIRTYLKRDPAPRESTGENVFDVRVEGRKWACSVTRDVDAGRQLDYACSRTSPSYTNIKAGPSARAVGREGLRVVPLPLSIPRVGERRAEVLVRDADHQELHPPALLLAQARRRTLAYTWYTHPKFKGWRCSEGSGGGGCGRGKRSAGYQN